MPRLSAIRIGALEEFAAQLRYAPREALLRNLQRIERLAAEIDPAINYPEDWFIHRITGYRPDLRNPATLVGEALLADLSALAERLSDEARLAPEDLEAPFIGLEQLCERWSVNRKTVERARRRGLIGMRVSAGRGRVRLVFSRESVEAYERAGGAGSGGTPRRQRLTADERRRIIRIAERARARFGWTLSETAIRLAEREARRSPPPHRSRETMRQVLLRHDAAAEAPIFDRTSPLSLRERRVIHRAMRIGVDPSRLATRFGRSRAAIHRAFNERRLELLRRALAAHPIGKAALERGDFKPTAADLEALAADVATQGLGAPVERTLGELLAGAAGDPIPNRFVEQTLARAHRALVARAGAVVGGLPRHNPRASELDKAETDLRWASMLIVELARSQRRLAVQSVEQALGAPPASVPGEVARLAHRVAFEAVLAGVASFDPEKGGRLAAPVGLAVGRALAAAVRASPSMHAAAGRGTAGGRAQRADADSIRLDDWSRFAAPWDAALAPPARLRREHASLPPEARQTLESHFGLAGGRPRTFAEAAAESGLSVPQAARVIRRAIGGGRAARARSR